MKLNLSRTEAIAVTLKAVEDIDRALSWYKDDLPGPGYVRVRQPLCRDNFVDIQLEREVLREALENQKQRLIQQLEDRFEGFEYDPDAEWTGD